MGNARTQAILFVRTAGLSLLVIGFVTGCYLAAAAYVSSPSNEGLAYNIPESYFLVADMTWPVALMIGGAILYLLGKPLGEFVSRGLQ